MPSELFAFSIGGLHVRSQFGEKFNASFEINLDFDGAVKVGLGDIHDYKKIGLERQDIMDILTLSHVESGSGLKSYVDISSDNPLFSPSFNLLVWVAHNGGTLLENFLITVNFQKDLAFNVSDNKKKTHPKKLYLHDPEPAISQNKASLLPEKEFLETELVARKEQKVANPEAQTPEESIAPLPLKNKVINRRRLSGVIWANPRSKQGLANVSIKKNDSLQNFTSTNEEYVLQKGERLFSVARKLKVRNYHPAQIAVTIWLHNIEKFMLGNIHGIREGIKLNLEKLEQHVSGIDLQTASNILKNQAVEWKQIISAVPIKDDVAGIFEIPLPSEKLEDIDDLFKRVKDWQVTWEKKDIKRHLDHYQTFGKENLTLANKKQLLLRHPKSRLATSSKFMVLKEGIPIVFFTQFFIAESLKSWGLKELNWVRTPSGWKIREEFFFKWLSRSGNEPFEHGASLKNRTNETKFLPFVIHVSSHFNKSLALSLTNQLRKNGFDAYWSSVKIALNTLIYRVYVGRFSGWKQANRFVQILRKKPFGSLATVIPYPLALQVGEGKSLKEARVILKSLRKSGFSGLLLVSYNELVGIHYRVVVGAFKKADNAIRLLRELKQFGFASELISP
jgi:hypothetical protein